MHKETFKALMKQRESVMLFLHVSLLIGNEATKFQRQPHPSKKTSGFNPIMVRLDHPND